MAQQVARSIKSSGQLSNYRLGVKYQDKVAWLLGTVSSDQQRQTAIELARQIEGVDQVISKLTIEGEEVALPRETAAVSPMVSLGEEKVTLPRVTPATAERPASRQAVPRRRLAPRPNARPMPMSPMPMSMSPRRASAIRTSGMQGRPMPASYQGCPPGGQGMGMGQGRGMGPRPAGHVPNGGAVGVSHDNAHMPGYAWPSYAAYPNYSAVTYPKQYSPSAWPYIGPFYPYPQVPLGWRKVTLEWDDGWWQLDFSHSKTH